MVRQESGNNQAAAPRVARFEEDEASPQDPATSFAQDLQDSALLWEPRVIKTETHLGEVTRVKDIEQGTEQGEGAAETKGQLSQYGAVEAAPAQDVKGPRSGISPVILIGAIFVPVVIFTITFIFSCTSIRYFHWALSYVILAIILGCIIYDPNVRKLHHDFQSPMGRMFKVIQVTNLMAWLMGAVDGYGNYIVNFKPYYDIERLAHYPAVDPSVFSGNMYMDAGQIDFFYNSKLDLTRTAGFKSQDIYCVAPIVGPTSQVINGTFAKQDNYDFWAVGINCCSGHSSDYQCGEFSNVNANKGLRLMRDDLKSYFRLAVEEAQAQYTIQARTPVFVYFMESPQDEIDTYLHNGYMELFHAFFGLIALQTCIVGLAASCYIYNPAV